MAETPPFYPNDADDMQCAPAALRMVLQHFTPGREWTNEDVLEITDYQPGKAVWPQRYLLRLVDLGFDVRLIELFDLGKFAETGYDYLLEEYGQEVADWQRDHAADFELERRRAKRLLEHDGIYTKAEPTVDQAKQFLDDGWLLHVLVNSHVLNGLPGYGGHVVVVYDYDADGFTLHDPGLPPVESRYVEFDELEQAWASPNPAVKTLIAIKPSN